MIRYSLVCDKDHNFDSWFQSADAFDKLNAAGLASCAICGSSKIAKAVMAPRVRPARSAAVAPLDRSTTNPPENPAAKPTEKPLSAPASPAEQALADLRRKIEKSSENVGADFAREARAIHHGEAPERPIYGEAHPEDAKRLIDDGIPVAPLPWSSRKTN